MVNIVDATADRWDCLADLIGDRGDPSRCWCQYNRGQGRYEHDGRDRNRAAMHDQIVDAIIPQGVLALDQKRAIGWCALAPRKDYPRLKHMQAAKLTQDEEGLWSVTCFVVRMGFRRQGVATELLQGAIELARRHDARIVEAYPVDSSARPVGSSAVLFQGPLSMYLQAGFAEVARTSATRAIVRLALD